MVKKGLVGCGVAVFAVLLQPVVRSAREHEGTCRRSIETRFLHDHPLGADEHDHQGNRECVGTSSCADQRVAC
jgi:hypothetical protein